MAGIKDSNFRKCQTTRGIHIQLSQRDHRLETSEKTFISQNFDLCRTHQLITWLYKKIYFFCCPVVIENFDGFKYPDYEFIHENTECALVFMIFSKFIFPVMTQVLHHFSAHKNITWSPLAGFLPKICENLCGRF